MDAMYERTALLLGRDGLDRLHRARVLVAGLGGVGSFAAEALARTGIGELLLVDPDRITGSNRNRQLIALCSTEGRLKVEVMQERIQDIAPRCRVRTDPSPVGLHHIRDAGPWDYILDAVDSVAAKVEMIGEARRAGVPVISVMGAGNRLDPTAFAVADIGATHTCPLAKRVRRELAQRGIRDGVPVVFSTEPPRIRPDCRENIGSLVWVTATAGMVAAGEVARGIAGSTEQDGTKDDGR